jgi:hypothetical protein
MLAQTGIAVVIMSLSLLVIQWIPWQRYTKKELTTNQRNTARMLAIEVPWVILLVNWKSWRELIALALMVIVAGIVMLIVTLFDKWSNAEDRASVAESAERILKQDVGRTLYK